MIRKGKPRTSERGVSANVVGTHRSSKLQLKNVEVRQKDSD